MDKIKNRLKELVKEESAQGMAEYVLLIVAIVGLGIMFKGKILEILQGKMDDIGSSFDNFNPQ
jgi:hypothetical protein